MNVVYNIEIVGFEYFLVFFEGGNFEWCGVVDFGIVD